MPYTCHLCADAEAATVLITPLQGGETMAIGPDCMVTGLCGLLSVATQVDAEQLYDAIIALRAADLPPQTPDEEERASTAVPATKRTRRNLSGGKPAPVADSEAATT